MFWSRLLGPIPRSTYTQATAWFNALTEQAAEANTAELAMLGGRLAATPGLAFLAGYQAALRALLPQAPLGIGAFCATEQRSSKAADIHTQLCEGLITGQKDFVIAGCAAQWLIVLAREEVFTTDTHLAAVLLATDHPNVTLRTGPALSILADIPHSAVDFNQAPYQRLPGDGWQDYSKPFRTLEDGHVLAAMCAWLYGQSLLDHWPQPLQLQLIAVLAALKESLGQPHRQASSHLLLAGALAQFAGLQAPINQALQQCSSRATAQVWQRDKAVLDIASSARTRRLEVARKSLAVD